MTSIAILVEGETEEKAFLPLVRKFIESRLGGKTPKLVPNSCDGPLPKEDKLRKRVRLLLSDRHDAVIALADVYTGTRQFRDADDAKSKMKQWVGEEPRFYPHVALYDFEAWLLPYWSEIQRLAGSNRRAPTSNPETVNHDKPPSFVLEEVFRTGTKRKRYVKTRDALAILRGQDLTRAVESCAELRKFLNTILERSGGQPL